MMMTSSQFKQNLSSHSLQGNSFSRVSSLQGQTLLSLAFNYGILSLMTLTIGTDEQKVNLVEHPTGCMLRLTEEEKIRMVVELLMRDFRTTPGSNVSYIVCVIRWLVSWCTLSGHIFACGLPGVRIMQCSKMGQSWVVALQHACINSVFLDAQVSTLIFNLPIHDDVFSIDKENNFSHRNDSESTQPQAYVTVVVTL